MNEIPAKNFKNSVCSQLRKYFLCCKGEDVNFQRKNRSFFHESIKAHIKCVRKWRGFYSKFGGACSNHCDKRL